MFSTKRRSSASLLNSLFHFLFCCCLFLSCFVFVVFYWWKMCCTSFPCFFFFFSLLFTILVLAELKLCQSVISIMREKIWDPSLVKEMKMESNNLAKNPYSQGRHLPPKLSNDGSANFVSTFFSSSKLFWKMVSVDLSHKMVS